MTLTRLTNPISVIASFRRSGECRIRGWGEAINSARSNRPSNDGSSQFGPIVSFSGSERSSTIAAATIS